jgi:hypothetical protein
MKIARTLPALAFAATLALCGAPAGAWTEARPAGLITEVVVNPDGGAEVTLRVRWRVLAGRLHQFELVELPSDLTLIEASAATSNGAALSLRATTPAPGRMEVSLGDERGGARRGTVDVVIRYTTSLRATGAIQRAGPDAVLEFGTVPWERGLEAAELRVTVPASARRAQWISDDTAGVDAETTTELSRDVVHALRRHLPPHTRWTARVAMDPNAFPWLAGRAALGPRPVALGARPWRGVALAGLGLATLFVLLGVTVARRSGPAALPLSRGARWLPAALLALGGALQPLAQLDVPFALPAGTLLVVIAIALRIPRREDVPLADQRAPARWVDGRVVAGLAPRSALGPLALTALLAAGGLAAGAWAVRAGSLAAGVAAVDLTLLAGALLALRLGSAPSDVSSLRSLGIALGRAVSAEGRARVAWRLRGAPSALGALRLRVVPRRGWRLARGVIAIEVACAWRRGMIAWQPRPFATIRAAQGSEAERALRELACRAGVVTVETDRPVVCYAVALAGIDADAFFEGLRRNATSLLVRAPQSATRSQFEADETATLSAAPL